LTCPYGGIWALPHVLPHHHLITLTPAVVCYLRREISFGNMHIRLGTPGYMGLGLLMLQVFSGIFFLTLLPMFLLGHSLLNGLFYLSKAKFFLQAILFLLFLLETLN